MNWIRIASLDNVDADCGLAVRVESKEIALFKLDGEVFATDNICTHQYALLTDGYLEDGCIECPLHQGRFDVRTGKAQGEPVTVDIATYPVRVDGSEVYVQWPETGAAS
jgi:3-phenylpropionate/trans-cinnamate dioxygenase ferredoxin subunit